MTELPRDPSPESTLALRADPYGFISKRCRRLGADAFEARILLQKTVCMTGRDAAAAFYDPARMVRKGAAPGLLRKTLLGRGGIQTTDGEVHRARKRMFLTLMTPEHTARLVERMNHWWAVSARRWAGERRVVLYDELHEVLARAACEWASVPLPEADVPRRTRQLAALFDAAGAANPLHLWSRLSRWRADRWAADLIEQVRGGKLDPPEGAALAAVARYREPGGELLPPRLAGVELLNVVRPVVAVSVFITFAAVALNQHPGCRERLRADGGGYAEWFAHEVRRLYPFFPAAVARVREEFEWHGYRLPKGRRVLLDLYGTNHDPRVWGDPGAFRPERFRGWNGDPFNFVPQGGGEYAVTHRCPGERPTIELMKAATALLAGGMEYEVPDQDLSIDTTRLPALPRSRFVMANVRVGTPARAHTG